MEGRRGIFCLEVVICHLVLVGWGDLEVIGHTVGRVETSMYCQYYQVVEGTGNPETGSGSHSLVDNKIFIPHNALNRYSLYV